MLNQKGISLINVMIAASILSAASLGYLRMSENVNQVKNSTQSSIDEEELDAVLRMLLGKRGACSISIAQKNSLGGSGVGLGGSTMSAVVLKKKDYDEADEGYEIGLYLSDQDGNKRTKLIAAQADGNGDPVRFGNLVFESVKLRLNGSADVCGQNYCVNSSHDDVATVEVIYKKKTTALRTTTKTLKYEIELNMSTTSGGNTTLNSCSRETDRYQPLVSDCEMVESPTTSSSDNQRHDVECPAHKVGIGIAAYASDTIDGPLQLTCCKVKGAQTIGSEVDISSGKGTYADNQHHAVVCPSNTFLIGYGAYAGSRIDGNLEGKCIGLEGISEADCTTISTDVNIHYNNRWQLASCPDNMLLKGVDFWAESRFDAISQLTCCNFREN